MRNVNTLSGTLKMEIINGHGDEWNRATSRLRVFRWTLAAALNQTMSALYAVAVEAITAARRKDKEAAKQALDQLRAKATKTLQMYWNAEIEACRANEEERLKGGYQKDPFGADAYLPVTDNWTAETSDHILSRFSGEHFKDLMALRASTPSFSNGAAFMARSRACTVEGDPENAYITAPLFGAGPNATRLRVAVCGHWAENTWVQLVETRAKLDEMHKLLEARREECKKAKIDWKKDPEALSLKAAMEATGPKVGRIGFKYNEQDGKWYALVSWSRQPAAEPRGSLEAVAHIGTWQFVQVLASNGDALCIPADQILATRERFHQRRKSLGKAKRFMGTGSKGHGKKRRELPLTRLKGKEAAWVRTFIQQNASYTIRWCLDHNVGVLYWPDMAGMRENFERATQGKAHENVKRRIHEFPFYEQGQAIARQGKQHGVMVVFHKTQYDSTTCPCCGHASLDNLKDRKGRVETVIIDGKKYERRETFKMFVCQECGFTRYRDIIACANAFARLGRPGVLERMAAKARKAIAEAIAETTNQEVSQ